MTTGSKVICIDDSFPGPLRKLYVAVPVKGETYTIRSVYPARRIAFPSSPGASDGEIGVLLAEIVNPPDPKSKYGLELGFKAERFREIEESKATNSAVEELEAV
jgi:hypothetical protein